MATTVRLVPSTYYLSSSYLSISNATNMNTNTDSTTYATVTNTRTGTSSYYLYIRGFNFSSVPSDAIVSSITIKLKAYHSGGNTGAIGGYNGTTQVSSCGTGTALTTSASVITFTNTTIDWDTLKGYGDDFGLRINCKRSNRNNQATFYVYGAEIVVTYTVPVYHTVTSSGDGTLTPSGATSVEEGSSYTLFISELNSPNVTDNGTDVTSQLVQASGGTSVLIPDGNTNSNFSVTNISNAYTDASSTTYASLELNGGTTGTIYLDLDGNIPSGATIQSVACSFTYQYNRNGSSSGFSASCQMYTGSTAKGSSYTLVSSGGTDVSKTTVTLTVGSWTLSEISNARLYITATNSASQTHRFIYVYGVSFSVTYSISGTIYTYTISSVTADHTIVVSAGGSTTTMYIKLNGSWVEASAVYVKTNGSWVLQSDLANVFDPNTNYVANWI